MFNTSGGLAAVIVLVLTAPLWAAHSTFDTDMDGWTGDSPISWDSSGGNPGGYLLFQDDDGSSSWVTAPSQFSGDWSALDGTGQLRYDHKLISTGNQFNNCIPYRVSIYSGNNWAYWEGDTPTGPTDWVTVVADIDVNDWTVVQGSWTGILANVTNLYIRMEHANNSDHANNFEGIDNVIVVPEPASLSLLAISGLLAATKCRRVLS